jgi:hypothetical protein
MASTAQVELFCWGDVPITRIRAECPYGLDCRVVSGTSQVYVMTVFIDSKLVGFDAPCVCHEVNTGGSRLAQAAEQTVALSAAYNLNSRWPCCKRL